MTATVQFNLGKYLREHGLTAYALVKEVEGIVPASTVYGLARKPVQRIDLPVVYALLDALRRLRGVEVEFDEFVEEQTRCTNDAPRGADLQLPDNLPIYDASKAKKFVYSGVRVKPIKAGPPAEVIIAQLRGHE